MKGRGRSFAHSVVIHCLENNELYPDVQHIIQHYFDKRRLDTEAAPDSQKSSSIRDDPEKKRAYSAIQRLTHLRESALEELRIRSGIDDRKGWLGWHLKVVLISEDLSKGELDEFRRKRLWHAVATPVRKGFTPRNISMAFLVLFGLSYFFIVVGNDKVSRIRRLGQDPTQENRAKLRDFYNTPNYELLRPVIVRTIAQINSARDESVAYIKDTSHISAVFALDERPFIVLDGYRVIELGDYLTIGPFRGYLSEVNQSQIALIDQTTSRSFRLPRVDIFSRFNIRSFPITIYLRPDNMEPLLRSVCNARGISVSGQLEIRSQISGSFINESLDEFLAELSSYGAINYDPSSRQLHLASNGKTASIIGFTPYFDKLFHEELGQLLDLYGHHLGFKVELDLHGNALKENDLIYLKPSQFPTFCKDLGLIYRTDPSRNIITVTN